ncbi:alpha-amylase A isoform X2 [Folsomia candida]|uniref:alpha-amylase A isoform X2 n=1 Tax=Folsomia candida TaxID=158441 RepID=UPI001604F136|nr:alpha-amylase A isoform X2 [Folsomia candida]
MVSKHKRTPTSPKEDNLSSTFLNGSLTISQTSAKDFLDHINTQTSPVTENVLQLTPFRPWSERYTPVSYQFTTRSGNESELASMIQRCNAVGVRIYVDVVLNHMSGRSSCCIGTGGSSFDPATKSYPGVPYTAEDFNGHGDGLECESDSGLIDDYQDVTQIKNCELDTLRDLNQKKASVQNKIVEFLNKLIGFGVAGFRVDASKYMWVQDLEVIFSRLDNLSTSAGFPENAKPFIVMEVWDLAFAGGTDPVHANEYHHLGRTTEFQYGMFLGDVLRGFTPLKNLWNFGEPWGMYASENVLVFVDNHDNQRYQGFYDTNILTFRNGGLYRMAQGFAQAWPFGLKRVMSSYYWEPDWQDGKDRNNWMGPPHDDDGNTLDVPINNDLTCGGGWICEHRWREIFNMVSFGNVVHGTPVTNWWDNGNNQIAFCRGNKGFVAMNNEQNVPMDEFLMTCLPAGDYCDVISGNVYNGTCSGKTIRVALSGSAEIYIPHTDETRMVAIHVEAKLP